MGVVDGADGVLDEPRFLSPAAPRLLNTRRDCGAEIDRGPARLLGSFALGRDKRSGRHLCKIARSARKYGDGERDEFRHCEPDLRVVRGLSVEPRLQRTARLARWLLVWAVPVARLRRVAPPQRKPTGGWP